MPIRSLLPPMVPVTLVSALFALGNGQAQEKTEQKKVDVKSAAPVVKPTAENVSYGKLDRQVLDVYSPPDAKNLPVVFCIHGGGGQTGDKKDIEIKPQFFNDKRFVFVSTTYRLLPGLTLAD